MNPLVELHAYGQSFWYDNIRRKFLQDGTLQRMIDKDGLRGMTSNPSIFEKAIGQSDDYDGQIQTLVAEGADVNAIYEALAIADIQAACDLFTDLYAQSGGGDGFVSLEVSPHLARDTEGTIAEARRLFATVARPNLMIKVPATKEGIPAIRQLISEGININVTLMFSMDHYEAVANAYTEGLTQLLANGGDVSKVASVASFFVSRVDSAVDKELAGMSDSRVAGLLGKVAIANSKVVYLRFKEIFQGEAFAALQAAGGTRQRLLWASTSTKNPTFHDTLYIDSLIGAETVNTIPPATVDAFRDHGTVGNTLETAVAEAQSILETLADVGVDLDAITEKLQADGVDAFSRSFDGLMETIGTKRGQMV